MHDNDDDDGEGFIPEYLLFTENSCVFGKKHML